MTVMDHETYETLRRLESVEDAPSKVVVRRAAELLYVLAGSGYVESSGPAGDVRIRITKAGRAALAEHRKTMEEQEAD